MTLRPQDADAFARHVDAWGRTAFDADDALELLYAGLDQTDILVRPSPALDRANETAKTYNKTPSGDLSPPAGQSPRQAHIERANRWLMPPGMEGLDVRATLLDLCETDEQRERVNQEMDLFEARGLENLLRMMFVVVHHFRANNVVWGVGRGSSVASYCLYLIGITKVDPIRYGLDIRDFLK